MWFSEGGFDSGCADEYDISMFAALGGERVGMREVEQVMAVLSALDPKAVVVEALPSNEMAELIKSGYADDMHLPWILVRLSKGEVVPGFFVQGGLLFRASPIDGTQLCVPEGEALNKLLFAAHDANAHVGIDKTVSALKAFYIPHSVEICWWLLHMHEVEA